jgi:CRISPR-associated endonuclease Cas2
MSLATHQSQRWLLAYDISAPRDRRRIARTLEGHATRLQRSVFYCEAGAAEVRQTLQTCQPQVREGDRLHAWIVHSRPALPAAWQKRLAQARNVALPAYWVV